MPIDPEYPPNLTHYDIQVKLDATVEMLNLGTRTIVGTGPILATDDRKLVIYGGAQNINLEVPATLPLGMYQLMVKGPGMVTVVAGSGAAVNPVFGETLTSPGPNSLLTVLVYENEGGAAARALVLSGSGAAAGSVSGILTGVETGAEGAAITGITGIGGTLVGQEVGQGTAAIAGTVAASGNPELFPNGDFSSTTLTNVTWYSIGPAPTYGTTYTDAVGAVVGGRLRITNPATRAYPYGIFSIALSAGQYDVSVELPAGTGYGEVRAYTNSADPEGSTIAPLIVIAPGGYPAIRSFTITHPGGNLYLSTGIQTDIAGDWVEFDNISIKAATAPAFITGALGATEVGQGSASIIGSVAGQGGGKIIPPPPSVVSSYNQIFLEDWSQGLRYRSNTMANNNATTPTDNDYGYPDGGYQAGTGLWQSHLKWPNAALVAHHGLPSAFANMQHPSIQQYAADRCRVEGNELVLRCGPIPAGLTLPNSPEGPYTYLSAQLSTRWSFYCVFGWLEVCVWLKPAQGLFAAPLWLTGNLWPPEIDVSEVVDNTQHQTIHSDGYNAHATFSKPLTAFPAGGGYMRFASLWLPDRIQSWYANGLDGAWTFSGESLGNVNYNQAQMNQAQYLVTGVACNTPWAGTVDESQMPFISKINYIRVLQAPGGRYHYGLGANSPVYSSI
jgi:hypothetical protein